MWEYPSDDKQICAARLLCVRKNIQLGERFSSHKAIVTSTVQYFTEVWETQVVHETNILGKIYLGLKRSLISQLFSFNLTVPEGKIEIVKPKYIELCVYMRRGNF